MSKERGSEDEKGRHRGSSNKQVSFAPKLAALSLLSTDSNVDSLISNPLGGGGSNSNNSNRSRHNSHSHSHHLNSGRGREERGSSNGNSQKLNSSSESSNYEDESEECSSSPDLLCSSPSIPNQYSSNHISELPDPVLETIFSFLPLPDLKRISLVSTHWNRLINSENSDIWKSRCLSTLNADGLRNELVGRLGSYKAKLRAFAHAWNPNDCSRNIYVKANGFTIHRNPVAQSTDGVRGKIGFTRGRHCWDVVWEGPLGTVAVVGIATQRAEMRAQGYLPLLGQDDQSWGWNLVENCLLHNGDSQGNYPLINNAPKYQVGERIRVILDCEDRTLSFERDAEFYGVAFRGLPSDEPLFPSISAVYGNTEITMVYQGPPLDG